MGKFTEYIGSQFANPRGVIDKCCCLIMNSINKAMYKNIVKNIFLQEQSNILDIGYGNGYLIKKIYKKYKPNIYGIDISEDMKKIATKKNSAAVKVGKINLEVGDCCNLDYEDNTFDGVTSVNTIYFWSDTLVGLSEIHRVLKKDAIFYNAVYSKEFLKKLSYTKKGFKFFDKDELISIGEEAGFSKVVVSDIVNGKSYIVKYIK